ncbi:MAG: carbohydrate kinase family protein [Candidatus Methanofastidiosia archaeon]
MRELDVLCIGNLNLDLTFFLEDFPREHQKIICEKAHISLGGAAGNTACFLSSLGLKTGFLGCVGKDLVGEAQIRELESYGVETSHISQRGISGIAVILLGKDKRMVKYPGANLEKELDFEYIRKARHVHLSSNEREDIEKILKFCKKRGIQVSYDPGENRFLDLMSSSDYLFLNEDELGFLVGEKELEDLRDLNPKILVVTKNEGGCIVKTKSKKIEVESFGVKSMDTTGAGDAFDAGFIYGLVKKKSLKECGILGVACASLTVQKKGARSGITDERGLLRFLRLRGG